MHIARLLQHCHNSKFVIFREKILNGLKCYNFLWVQRRHNCSPAASFANCVMTLYLLKVHLRTFLSIPITQKCQILSCNTIVANEWYVVLHPHIRRLRYTWLRNTGNICSLWLSRSIFWPVSWRCQDSTPAWKPDFCDTDSSSFSSVTPSDCRCSFRIRLNRF